MSSKAISSSKTEKRRTAECTKKLESSVLQFVLELDDLPKSVSLKKNDGLPLISKK